MSAPEVRYRRGSWTLKQIRAESGHVHECRDCVVDVSYWAQRGWVCWKPKVCAHHSAMKNMIEKNMIWPALHDKWERAM